MTVRRVTPPVMIAAVLVVYAWTMTLMAEPWLTASRGVNFGLIIALLIWFARRVDRRLQEVADIVNNSERGRLNAVAALNKRADMIARALEQDIRERNEAHATALADQTKEIVAKIEEGTTASRDAQREANNVNEKIASLGQRLLDATPPREQVDDIQATGHESLTMLGEMAKKDGAS